MTISVTELAHKSSIGTAVSWQSPTFNTVDGGEIWVAVMCGSTTAMTVSSNDGGWTFDNNLLAGPQFNYRVNIFRAVNTTGQTGRTVTVSAPSSDGYDACVFQVLGDFDEVQNCLYVGTSGEPITIGTLAQAATSGNFCLLFVGMNEDGTGHAAISVSGWTAESVNSWSPNANFFYGINVLSKEDFTGTSVSVTEYAVSPTHGMGAIIELAESTGIPPAPTIRGWATATNTTDALPAVALNLPTRVAGDLLLAFAAEDSATALTHTQTTAWAELSDEAGTGANRLGVYARIATNDANDALSIAGANSADASFNMVAITVGTHDVTDVTTDIIKVASATGASGNADPPSIDGGSSKNWLAIAAACVDLTATGSAITAAPTNYATNAIMQKSAASTSSVALGVGPRRTTAVQTENPGAFTNTSGAWIAKTLLIPPVPPAPNEGSASGAIAWVGSADGEAPTTVPQGSASGAIAWVGSSTGITTRRGSASGTVGWAGSSTGTTVRRGSASGAIGWVGSSTGVSTHKGSSTGAISWVGSADGDAPLDLFDGAANGAISWVGSVLGTRPSQGAASGSIAWAGVVVGANLGVVIGSIQWVGSATGSRTPTGASSGAITWAGSATGETPAVGINDGSATGAISWVGLANGQTMHKGNASGAMAWVGSVIGEVIHKGSSVGSIAWVGSVEGLAPFIPMSEGDAVGGIIWVGSVTGSIQKSGVAVGAIMWVGVATSPLTVDPAVFLLVAHVSSHRPRVAIGHEPQIIVGHKAIVAKGRDGG